MVEKGTLEFLRSGSLNEHKIASGTRVSFDRVARTMGLGLLWPFLESRLRSYQATLTSPQQLLMLVVWSFSELFHWTMAPIACGVSALPTISSCDNHCR